ncbi:cellulose-binding domain-containing protein [Winogradskya consettensis]|uniref:Hydrolase n=1 Tax=Winogradskya consettensis TaxID=113560 RepID=A0A919VS08_9ACTN|nr:cellulose-binding domain-containing protein [Actinoplanes consettensis]GIM76644.1 hydrolase [Actinoplanes consettensis]
MWKRSQILGVTLAAAATVLAAGYATAPAFAVTACDVAWATNSWSTGFTADIKLTNNAAPLTSWSLTWTFPGSQQITSGWNAGVTQSGRAVTATNVAWNGSLGTGASASFGVQGTSTGSFTTPTDFAVNGISCSGAAPSPSPSSPSPSSPPTSTPPPSSGSGDSFENQAAGTPAGDWSVSTPDCSGAGTATIDKAVAHTGTTSLRINGAAGYCNHVFAANTSILNPAATAWYVRYWVRHTTALPVAHTTAVALRDAADANKDLRFGGQNAALQWNRASDDATLPEQSPAGVALSRPLPVNTWTCVEFSVNGADGTMETWLDGVSVPGLRQDGVPTHDIDSQWLNRTYRPRLTDLRLGWESYGEGADTLWYDDVAVAATRIGC